MDMRRASASRREHPAQQTVQRSRSSEGLGGLKDAAAASTNTTTNDSSDDDIFQDATSSLQAESTDNDSAGETHGEGAGLAPSSASKRGFHTRAMSDPFDTQEMQDALSEQEQQQQQSQAATATTMPPAAGAYPTLLRFPVAETRNKNCWSEPPVTIFSVRGKHYFVDKKKQTSQPYLLTARGTDIFLFDTAPVRLQER